MSEIDPQVVVALARSQTIDMTTTGRTSGQPRRIEIMLHAIDGRLLITGHPGFPRAWMANLAADPRLTIHLKGDVVADVPATARIVSEPDERERLLAPVSRLWNIALPLMVGSSPLIEVTPD